MNNNNYQKMAVMLIVSFAIMYLVMFLNVDAADHIYLSLTRTYMSLLMVSPMAVLMLVLMGKMYPDKKLNRTIGIAAIAVFIGALGALRSQALISDQQYMQAMIPHHSSAIMTSKHANIKDPEVKKLSQSIIESQEREIQQMKEILNRMKK